MRTKNEQAESIAEVTRLNLPKHNGYFFEHNDSVIKHNEMKNRELWNNILSQFLRIMYRCLGTGVFIYKGEFYYMVTCRYRSHFSNSHHVPLLLYVR